MTPAASPPPEPLALGFRHGSEERSFVLGGTATVTAGRAPDNHLVLADPSVSRHHAELRGADGRWVVVDRGSTNGVRLNGERVERAPLAAGDRLDLGSVTLQVRAVAPADEAAVSFAEGDEDDLLNATILRRLDDLPAGLLTGAIDRKREALDAAYGNRVFGHLTRLAGELLRTDSLDQVLRRVLDVAFEALPVERGYVFLVPPEGDGELRCELAREGSEVVDRPRVTVPVSRTLLRAVVDRGVALVTPEAAVDPRLQGAGSARLHGLRSALCAPLWSGASIVGALLVDSPSRPGTFTEADVDLASALANFAAVAIERIRFAERADRERRLRARLERYHSPAVIGEVLSRVDGGDGARVRPHRAEVSVLFADLVGFSPLAESAQPEEVAVLLGEFFNDAVAAIFDAGGTLDKFIGDCVMAFFGAPVPQADHAARAVRAAQAVRRAVGEWGIRRVAAGGEPVAVRVGVHSGPVVVGEVGSERRVDYTVLGNTVNVAARLQERAAAGEVVLSAATLEQLPAPAACESLGELELRGLSRRIAAYRLLPPSELTRPGR